MAAAGAAGPPQSAVPQSLKAIAPYIRIAAEHESKNPVIAYWCRFYALENGLKMNKSADARTYLVTLMDDLEKMKAQHRSDEAFTNDLVAQSHIEAHAIKLFSWADQQDRNSNFDRAVIRAFHAAGYIFDILANFGEVSEESLRMSRYAKWKAAYIHKCLKEGTQPIPGPLKGDDEGFEEDAAGPSNTPPQQQPGSSRVTPDGAPTPMPRGNAAGGGREFDMGLPVVPQVPRAPKDESTGAYPKVMPPPQAPSPHEQQPKAVTTPTTPVAGGAAASSSSYGLPAAPPPASESAHPQLSITQMLQAQKYCKYATSALTFEDTPTAILNLQKALTLLTTGLDPE